MAPSTLTRSQQVAVPAATSWSLLAVFGLAVAFLGGSSRADVVQIAALRPIAALALIPALYLITTEATRFARVPMILFAALAAWMTLQLLPLPSGLWQALPDRDVVGALDSVGAEGETWRSISMVPASSLNALTSLLVPASALALALALRLGLRDLLLLIAGLGAVDALLGIFQLLTGANGPFYYYSITSRGSAVGIFGNANHSAIFSSVVMLVSARLFLDEVGKRGAAWLRIVSGATFVLGLLSVLINNSRAGFVAGLFALGACVVMVYLVASVRALKDVDRRSGRHRKVKAKVVRIGKFESQLLADPRKLATIGIVAVLTIAALFVLNGRAAGLEDLLRADSFEDLRWELFPVLQSMVSAHWLLGTGFGSFEEVYHIYEPTQLLLPLYVNQAHNDWAQLIIEGGVPAAIILLLLLGWVAKSVWFVARSEEGGPAFALFWAAAFGAIMAASVPDYPLRAPIFQVVGVWLILALAKEAERR